MENFPSHDNIWFNKSTTYAFFCWDIYRHILANQSNSSCINWLLIKMIMIHSKWVTGCWQQFHSSVPYIHPVNIKNAWLIYVGRVPKTSKSSNIDPQQVCAVTHHCVGTRHTWWSTFYILNMTRPRERQRERQRKVFWVITEGGIDKDRGVEESPFKR